MSKENIKKNMDEIYKQDLPKGGPAPTDPAYSKIFVKKVEDEPLMKLYDALIALQKSVLTTVEQVHKLSEVTVAQDRAIKELDIEITRLKRRHNG